MLRITLLFLLLGSLFSPVLTAQQDIDVPQTYKPLITKRTADWCPRCGSWGWTFFKDVIAQHEENATLIAAHFSGGLANPVATTITGNFGGFSQPRFYYNDEDLGVSSNANSQMERLQDITNRIQSDYAVGPVAQTGLEASIINGETIQVNAAVEFFKDTSGTFSLGFYVVEKEVIAYQAGFGNEAPHVFLLREAMTEEVYGEQIGDTMHPLGTRETFTVEMPLGNYVLSNLEIVAVIWNQDGNTYTPVNTNSVDAFTIVDVEEPAELTEFNVFPTVTAALATIDLSVQVRTDVHLDLYANSGQHLRTVFAGELGAGTQQLSLDVADLAAGTYWLRLKTPNGLAARQVVIRH